MFWLQFCHVDSELGTTVNVRVAPWTSYAAV